MHVHGIVALILTIWIGMPVGSKIRPQSEPQSQAEDVKELDDFFNNDHLLAFSGCERSAWVAIHDAVKADVQKRELSASSVEDDVTRADQVMHCFQRVSEKQRQAYTDLNAALISDKGQSDVMAHPADANAALSLALRVNDDRYKIPALLEAYNTLGSIKSFAEEAASSYGSHADDTRYRILVTRYNSLAKSMASAPLAPGYSLPSKPQPLHCESSTNPVTQITQMDCQ